MARVCHYHDGCPCFARMMARCWAMTPVMTVYMPLTLYRPRRPVSLVDRPGDGLASACGPSIGAVFRQDWFHVIPCFPDNTLNKNEALRA